MAAATVSLRLAALGHAAEVEKGGGVARLGEHAEGGQRGAEVAGVVERDRVGERGEGGVEPRRSVHRHSSTNPGTANPSSVSVAQAPRRDRKSVV